jgi:hypothetical protein
VVMALAAKDDTLFVGGKFDRFSPSTSKMHGLAMFDSASQQWEPLGAGISGGHVLALLLNCSALDEDSGYLNGTNGTYGVNTSCASDSGICNKTGNANAIPSGPCGARSAMQLFAGGTFSMAGQVQAKSIAMWDGYEWSSIGNLNGEVHAFSKLSDWLYVGGTFTEVQYGQIGSPYGHHLNLQHVARYRAGVWQSMGSGVGGPVYALISIRGCVYVGGSFDRVCGSRSSSTTGAHSCAQEADAENFQTTNSLARMCYEAGEDSDASASLHEWQPVTSHDRHSFTDHAKVRALASFDEEEPT